MIRLAGSVALLVAWFAVACAITPPHEHEIGDGWRGAPDVERVLLAPMNATGSIAAELEPGADRIIAIVKRYLETHGIAVETAPLFRFRNAWTRSFEGIDLDPKQRDVPSEVIAKLIETLRVNHDFDLLILPSLEIRPARLNGYTARWDGVSRKLEDDKAYYGRSTWRGATNAASLRTRIYTEGGDRIFDSVGGLDMVFKYAGGRQMTLVDDPLSDEGHLHEGVRIAFDPFIPFAR